MPGLDDRLARYALFAPLHALLVVLAVAGLFGTAAGPVVLLASLPLLFAPGAFQADLAIRSGLEEPERSRWRVVLWCLPWSMTAYWYLHVRPRVAD